MKNTLLALVLLTATTFATAQNVGINNTTPHASAIMDIASTNKGLLIPRLPLTSVLDVTTIPAPLTSLMIYNTATAGVSPNDVKPGYYYYDGTKWVGIGGSAWSLTGNAGTSAGTNFVGTTDTQDLVFKTNSIENMRILNSNGNVGIGTITPTEKLEINGKLLLTNGFSATNGAIMYKGLTDYLYIGPQSGTSATGAGINLYGSVDNTDLNPGGVDFITFPFSHAMRILGNGNVGIGTGLTPPANKLEITQGSAGNSGLRFTNLLNATALSTNATGDVVPTTLNPANALYWGLTGNAGTTPATNFVGTTDAQDFVTRTNNTEVMRVTSTGNVGIGTNAPTARTHIYEPTGFAGTVNPLRAALNVEIPTQSSNGYYIIKGSGGSNLGAGITYGLALNLNPTATAVGTRYGIYIENETQNYFSNNVGIGTTTPGTTLHLHSPANNHHALRLTAENQTDYWDLVKRGQTYGGGANDNFVLAYNLVERINITPSGNFGINVVTPTEKLHVAGSVRIVDGTEGADKILTSDATGKANWRLPPSSVTANDGALAITSSNTGGGTANNFYTNYIVLPKGVYHIIYYNCIVSVSPSYYLQATTEASAGTISSGAVNIEGVQMTSYNQAPFILKVLSATATVRFTTFHATGGNLTDAVFPSPTCTSFIYTRIGD